MARGRSDECMFCGGNPCECNKPSKPTRIRKVPTGETPAVAPPAKRLRPPAKVPHAATVRSPAPAQRTPAPVKQYRTEEEQQWRRAITIIAESGLIGEDELTKHRASINLPPWKIDALIWKSQNSR
jgi:hypothetical protein